MMTTPTVDRETALAALAERRSAKGMTLADLAARLGKSPVFVGAVFSGQAMLTPQAAEALASELGMSAELLTSLTQPPVRTSDPFLYRLHEMMTVYGEALRTCTNEAFGDGILSAIDLKVSFERRENRAVIVFDSKFLSYGEF
jgi:cyanate lyase